LKASIASAAIAAALLTCAAPAAAQSTDGYHSIQVFPVVVDTASFAQQFNFTTPNLFPVTLKPTYYPGSDSAGSAVVPVTCPDIVIPANGNVARASLRAICPAMADGSAFGFLHIQTALSSDGMYADIPVFAGFSRVSNPEGNGFSVEAYPVNTFTSGVHVINGLRRLAATSNSPTFQTNCFIGNVNQLDPDGTQAAKRVTYTLHTAQGEVTAAVDLLPGKLVRLLDVFATAGAAAGDHNNVAAVFRATNANNNTTKPGIMTFCTVQDNTSYGADFRIGKVAFGALGIASNDGMAAREWGASKDVQDRAFEIGTGNSANTHVVYFKHPDVVQCRLIDPVTSAPLTAASGLEMRASDEDQLEAEGGDNQTGTGMIYLGDKPSQGGFNARYVIEVESNETNTGAVRPYMLYCSSGSGNTYGYELIKYKEAVDRF
jgi:hypothetical protein